MASLARIAPDAVLHNVMPIFTFMGSNVFHRDDTYSFRVVQKVRTPELNVAACKADPSADCRQHCTSHGCLAQREAWDGYGSLSCRPGIPACVHKRCEPHPAPSARQVRTVCTLSFYSVLMESIASSHISWTPLVRRISSLLSPCSWSIV